LLTMLLIGSLAVAAPASSEDSLPWLGVFLGDAVDGGVELVALVSGGPAAMAGLRKGDVVIQAGEFYLADVQDLEGVLAGLRPGDPLELQLLRAGKPIESVVNLSARPGTAWSTLAPPVPAEVPPRAEPVPPVPVGFHGLRLTDVTPDLRLHYGAPEDLGVLVTGVVQDLAGDLAGLQVGDVVVRVGDIPVRVAVDVDRLLRVGTRDDGEIVVSLVRGQRSREVKLVAPSAAAGSREYRSVAEMMRTEGVDDSPRAREMLARSLELEIRRLRERVDELTREMEALRERR